MKSPPRACRGACVKRLTKGRYNVAFTLIELIVVITVIIILTGLVLSTVGYAQKKGARARDETEISAMSAASESYKADNVIYARSAGSTGTVGLHHTNMNILTYDTTSRYIYVINSGYRVFV